MLGSDADGQSIAESSPAAPRPPRSLQELVEKIDRAFTDLSETKAAREAMHTVRSGLSDICALTEADPQILNAVDRLVGASDGLAEAAASAALTAKDDPRPRAAQRALKDLEGALTKARPSRIAVSLGRGW